MPILRINQLHEIYLQCGLKGFKQIELQAGECQIVSFEITSEDLKFYNHELEYVCEPGEFEVMIGPNSRDVISASFVYN